MIKESKIVQLTIKNWDKINGNRTDVKKASWFKLSNEFFYDDKIYELDIIEKSIFIFILCEFCRQNPNVTSDQIVNLNIEKTIRTMNLDRDLAKYGLTNQDQLVKCVVDAIEKLVQLQLVNYFTSRTRNGHVTDSSRTRNGFGPSDKKRLDKKRINTMQSESLSLLGSADPVEEVFNSNSIQSNSILGEEKKEKNCAQKKEKSTALLDSLDQAKAEIAAWWEAEKNPCLPSIRGISSGRWSKFQVFKKQFPDRTVWLEAMAKVSESDFLLGKVEPEEGQKRFVCDFDFFFNPQKFLRILEGYYSKEKLNKNLYSAISEYEKNKV